VGLSRNRNVSEELRILCRHTAAPKHCDHVNRPGPLRKSALLPWRGILLYVGIPSPQRLLSSRPVLELECKSEEAHPAGGIHGDSRKLIPEGRLRMRTHLIHGNFESKKWDYDHHVIPAHFQFLGLSTESVPERRALCNSLRRKAP